MSRFKAFLKSSHDDLRTRHRNPILSPKETKDDSSELNSLVDFGGYKGDEYWRDRFQEASNWLASRK